MLSSEICNMKNQLLQLLLLGTIITGLVKGPDYNYAKTQQTKNNTTKEVKLSGKIINENSNFSFVDESSSERYPLENLPTVYRRDGINVMLTGNLMDAGTEERLSVEKIISL